MSGDRGGGSEGGSVNAATVPGGLFTAIISSYAPGLVGGCNSTCRAENYEKQVRKQVVAGTTVGVCMVVVLVVFGVRVVWAWRRKVRRRWEGEG